MNGADTALHAATHESLDALRKGTLVAITTANAIVYTVGTRVISLKYSYEQYREKCIAEVTLFGLQY